MSTQIGKAGFAGKKQRRQGVALLDALSTPSNVVVLSDAVGLADAQTGSAVWSSGDRLHWSVQAPDPVRIEVYDAAGAVVLVRVVRGAGSAALGLPPGTYVARLLRATASSAFRIAVR